MQTGSNLQPWPSERHASIEEKQTPPSPKRKRARLKTVGDISHEMAKLYREARNGKIDVSDASKLANMLSILSRVLETSELEKRVEELESRGSKH